MEGVRTDKKVGHEPASRMRVTQAEGSPQLAGGLGGLAREGLELNAEQ